MSEDEEPKEDPVVRLIVETIHAELSRQAKQFQAWDGGTWNKFRDGPFEDGSADFEIPGYKYDGFIDTGAMAKAIKDALEI